MNTKLLELMVYYLLLILFTFIIYKNRYDNKMKALLFSVFWPISINIIIISILIKNYKLLNDM